MHFTTLERFNKDDLIKIMLTMVGKDNHKDY